MVEFLLEDSPAQFLSARPKPSFSSAGFASASTLGSQETFWLGNVGADLCEKFDGLHFGIFRAGEEPPGKERRERVVKGLGFSEFIDTEFLPDRGVEHLYAVGCLISGAVPSDGRLGIFPESRPCV